MRSRLAVCIVGCLALVAAGAHADEKAVTKALTPMYAKMVKAFKARDINAVKALITPDFGSNPSAKSNKGNAVLVEIAMQFAILRSMDTVTMKPVKVSVSGNKAVVTNRYSLSGTIEQEKGRVLNMADKGVTRDTWVKTAQGWRLAQIEQIKSNPTIDGKPLRKASGQAKAGAPKK